MKKLHIIVNSHWFNKIAENGKRIDYRDITDYWIKRLLKPNTGTFNSIRYIHFKLRNLQPYTFTKNELKYDFETITIQLGYTKNAKRIVFEFAGLSIDYPKKEWFLTNNLKGSVFNPYSFYATFFNIHLGNEISRNF